jgi:hypothetical protein
LRYTAIDLLGTLAGTDEDKLCKQILLKSHSFISSISNNIAKVDLDTQRKSIRAINNLALKNA